MYIQTKGWSSLWNNEISLAPKPKPPSDWKCGKLSFLLSLSASYNPSTVSHSSFLLSVCRWGIFGNPPEHSHFFILSERTLAWRGNCRGICGKSPLVQSPLMNDWHLRWYLNIMMPVSHRQWTAAKSNGPTLPQSCMPAPVSKEDGDVW